jgi:hypothetical protein
MVLLLQLIIAIIPIVPILFWLRMFSHMTKNDNLPQCFITFTNGRNSRLDWTMAFLFLSVFAAMVYYVTVYRNRQ